MSIPTATPQAKKQYQVSFILNGLVIDGKIWADDRQHAESLMQPYNGSVYDEVQPPTTIYSLYDEARDNLKDIIADYSTSELENFFSDNNASPYYSDILSEVADSTTPIYHYTLCEVAANSSECRYSESGNTGEDIMQQLQYNIYECILNNLHEFYEELKTEYELAN